MPSDNSQRTMRRDAEENRLALLNAAIVALAEDPDASLEAIAAAAGLSRRAVYGHFANRDELVAAAIERGAVRLTAATADVERDDPRVSLALLGSRLWDTVEQMRAMASLAVRGPSIAVVAAALAPVRERLRTIVETGVASGTLRSDVTPGSLSRLIEQTAIAVLIEATDSGLSRADGHRLVMLMALSTGGLSAAEAAALIDSTPELRTPIPEDPTRMKIELSGVSKGRDGASLPATSIRFETDAATLARAETERRPTVLGLLASGRMRPDTGRVLIDGAEDNAALRARVALVDAPDVSDPAPDVTVTGVTMEELMFAGLPGTRRDAALTLAQLHLDRYAKTSMADLPPADRIRLLTELAVLRDGVDGLVIVAPDRHGGNPLDWWEIAQALAARGYAVLVIAGDASAAAIGAESLIARLDSSESFGTGREARREESSPESEGGAA